MCQSLGTLGANGNLVAQSFPETVNPLTSGPFLHSVSASTDLLQRYSER